MSTMNRAATAGIAQISASHNYIHTEQRESQQQRKREEKARMDVQRNNGRNESIRYQQCRLFLLNHASKCNAEPDECHHVHCTETKDLLKHMADCVDGSCNVRNCASSRALMEHFKRCGDEDCGICGPVKDDIVDDYWKGSKRKLSFTAEFFQGTRRKLTF